MNPSRRRLLLPTFLLLGLSAASTARADLYRFFPVTGTPDTNPYARAALARVGAVLAKPVDPAAEGEILRAMPKYTDLYAFAGETQLLAFAYLTPRNPHHNAAPVRDALLARLDLLARAGEGGNPVRHYANVTDNHYNIFFFESFSFTHLALVSLAPDTVPPELKARIEKTLREGLTYQAQAPEGHELDGEYGIIPNIDLRYAVMLEVGARLFDEPALSGKANSILGVVAKYLMPDGAFLYYGGENQSFSYQESCLRDLARLHFLARSDRALELARGAKNYYPLSMEPGGVAEYSSAPNWKAFWNGSGMATGPEIAAHLGLCPINRGIAREMLRRNPELRTAYTADLLIAAGCYDPQAPTAPQADNLIVADSNVGGFRGRFGRFSFVADARDRRKTIPPISAKDNERDFLGTHLGKATYVGALVTDADDRFQPLNAALLRVHSAVTLDPSKPFWRGSAYLSHDSTDTVSSSSTVGGLSTRYGLGTANFGPTFTPTPGWEGREAWLFNRDHLVGLVELTATADATVDSLSGRIALGFGRTGPGLRAKSLETLDNNTYAYGDLRVRLLEHNYAALTIDTQAPYFRDTAKTATELVLIDKADQGKLTVPAGTKKHFLVEIYPATAATSNPARATLDSGIITLTAGTSTLYFNPTNAPLALPKDAIGTWTLPKGLTPPPAGEALSLPPYSHAILTR